MRFLVVAPAPERMRRHHQSHGKVVALSRRYASRTLALSLSVSSASLSRYQAPCSQATPWSSQPAYGRPTLAESSEAQGGQPLYAVSTHLLPASPSMSHRRAMVGPTKTSYCHSTSSEWLPSSRPDFPPASPCGNRELWADVPHRNRDLTEPTVRCVVYIHSFSLQRHGRKKVGSLRSAICLLAADV